MMDKVKKDKIKFYKPYRFMYYGLKPHRIIGSFVFMILWTLMNTANDRYLAKIADAVYTRDFILKGMLIKYCLILLAWMMCEFIGDFFNVLNSEDIEITTRKYFFGIMYRMRPSILRDYNTGYIAGLVDKISHQRREAYHRMNEEVPIAITYMAAVGVLLAIQYSPIFTLVLLITIILAVVIRIIIITSNAKHIDELNKAEAANTSLFIDTGTNINTVQKLQAFGFISTCFDESIKRCRKAVKMWMIKQEIGFVYFKLMSLSFLPICMIIQLKHPSIIKDPGEFYTFLIMIQLRLNHMTRSLSTSFVVWEKYKSPFRKVSEILSPEHIRENIYDKQFETAQIKNCDYSYKYKREFDSEEIKTVRVRIPEFQISKGDIVCVHGESGQGKTTLLNILSGEIETGEVYINDTRVDKRLDCVFIAQDTEIFDMSIRDNIKLGNDDIADDEIYELLDRVGLKEWIESQPEKLDTRLGERGVFVSTGQRQRLNLIRGLIIPNKEVYLLDEPTSNVDDETEVRMIELVKEKLAGKTAIIVTHKPRIRSICNRSYLFENGILSEETGKEA